LKLGERRELHESMMKSIYTSFKQEIADGADKLQKERKETRIAMRKTNIGMFYDNLALDS
jgi:hypothetical protein